MQATSHCNPHKFARMKRMWVVIQRFVVQPLFLKVCTKNTEHSASYLIFGRKQLGFLRIKVWMCTSLFWKVTPYRISHKHLPFHSQSHNVHRDRTFPKRFSRMNFFTCHLTKQFQPCNFYFQNANTPSGNTGIQAVGAIYNPKLSLVLVIYYIGIVDSLDVEEVSN